MSGRAKLRRGCVEADREFVERVLPRGAWTGPRLDGSPTTSWRKEGRSTSSTEGLPLGVAPPAGQE